MPNVINATSTGNGGLITQGDDSGILNIQTNETTAITVDADQRAAFVAGTAALPAITTAGDTNTGIFFPAADTIAFTEGGAEAMRIDSSGNVLVGATSPYSGTASNFTATTGVDIGSSSTATSKQLQFIRNGSTGTAGSIYATAGSFSNYCGIDLFIENVGGGSQAGSIKFNTTNNATSAERMRITPAGVISQNGNWGTNASTALRNTSAAANKFWQSGPDSNNAYIVYNQAGTGVYVVDGGTSWAGVSDERLKDIIEPITNGLNKVSTLRTVIGKFKTDSEGTRRSFLIAQDVQAVLPEAISIQDEETGTLGLSYTDVIPLLVASIQELKAINDTQAETINALTARIVALEGV
jgi:hypothetical protein